MKGKTVRYTRSGKFNHNDLTVQFGGELSKPHNIFSATAIKVPKYTYHVKERESLGNGWYGSTETNTYTEDNLYVIIKDGVCIGQMRPYSEDSSGYGKSTLEYCNEHSCAFLKTFGIEYKCIYED